MPNLMVLEQEEDLQQLAAKSGVGVNSSISSEMMRFCKKNKVFN
jgi:hypothetical protein